MVPTPRLRDMHTHLVYGVDDGPTTSEGMCAMIDAAHLNHVTSIYATSHHTPGVERFPLRTYRAHLGEARAYIAAQGYDLTLHEGAEILYTPALDHYIDARPLQTMGATDAVLVEFVPGVEYAEIVHAVELLSDAHYQPILAHIERYRCLSGSRVRKLRQRFHVGFQLNCGSLLESRGFLVDRRVRRWLAEGLIDFVASDMHDTSRRPNRMYECWERLRETVSADYLDYLTADDDLNIL